MTKQQNLLALRVLYLLWVIVGMYSLMYVPSQIRVAGDELATWQNIQDHQLLFRSGIAVRLFTQLLFIVVGWLLFRFLEDVSRLAAELMLILALVAVPIAMLTELTTIAAVTVADNADQVADLLKLHSAGINIASIFWGLWLLPLGYLVWHSTLFPKVLGVLLYLAGTAYFVGSFSRILVIESELLYTACEVLTFGEVIWLLWLVALGTRGRLKNQHSHKNLS
jgi:hypothetical protein